MSYVPTSDSIKNAFVNAIDRFTNAYPAIRDTTIEWLGRSIVWIRKTSVEHPLASVGAMNFAIGFTVPPAVDKIWNLFTDLPKKNEIQKRRIKTAVVYGTAALALVAANAALLSALGLSITALPVAAVVSSFAVVGLGASVFGVRKMDGQKLRAQNQKIIARQAKEQAEIEKKAKDERAKNSVAGRLADLTHEESQEFLNLNPDMVPQLRAKFEELPRDKAQARLTIAEKDLADLKNENKSPLGELKIAEKALEDLKARRNSVRTADDLADVQEGLIEAEQAKEDAQIALNEAGENPTQELQQALDNAVKALKQAQDEVERFEALEELSEDDLEALNNKLEQQEASVERLKQPLADTGYFAVKKEVEDAKIALETAEAELKEVRSVV